MFDVAFWLYVTVAFEFDVSEGFFSEVAQEAANSASAAARINRESGRGVVVRMEDV
jgi:hypothetical protein